MVYEIKSAYSARLKEIREHEYPQLNTGDCYLDHAGTTLYAASAIRQHAEDLLRTLYGNPHSQSRPSETSSQVIHTIRARLLLDLFKDDCSQYDLVFTSGTTASMRIVSELMRSRFKNDWHLAYSLDSHTSLIGLRECAGSFSVLSSEKAPPASTPLLYAWPGRSNATGKLIDCPYIDTAAKSPTSFTMLDAAALASSSQLRLTKVSPDFICISFNKLFGYPSGLGALLVKRTEKMLSLIQARRTFGGGTVSSVSVRSHYHRPRPINKELHRALEDGTVPFHAIIALSASMDAHERLYGVDPFINIAEHITSISRLCVDLMTKLKHQTGTKLVEFHDVTDGTPIVAFTLHRSDGTIIGYSAIQEATRICGIHIRSGTLCNPSVTEQFCDLTECDLETMHDEGYICSDNQDLWRGRPTGIARISFGAMTTVEDIQKWHRFLIDFFLESHLHTPSLPSPAQRTAPTIVLDKITVYPIKSCAGYKLPRNTRWRALASGLEYDRHWAIICLDTHKVMSQKANPRMALVRPSIDLDSCLLRISLSGLSFEITLAPVASELYTLDSGTICGTQMGMSVYKNPDLKEILSEFLGANCTLATLFGAEQARYVKSDHQQSWSALPAMNNIAVQRAQVLFANESPYLCITKSSLNELRRCLDKDQTLDPACFRANFEVSGLKEIQPFAEDSWTGLDGASRFEVLGRCRRCRMICVDQETGVQSSEPYTTLQKIRKYHGKLWFGVHLALLEGDYVQVGMRLRMR